LLAKKITGRYNEGMTVSTLNAFFLKLGRFQIKHRAAALALFILLTAICCSGLRKFKIANGSEGWYGDGDQLKLNKNRYEEVFGNSHSLGVLFTSDDVFTEESLKVIERIGQRMMAEIPFADKLTSIVEVDVPIGNEEGFEIARPYPNGIPSDPALLKKGRDIVMRGNEKTNTLINSLVSDDATETWISLSLLPYEGDADEASLEAGQALIEILQSDEFKSDKYKLFGIGQPYTDKQEELYEYPDYIVRVAGGFVVMLLFLLIFVRTPVGVVVPALATTGAIASVLGAMAYFNAKADSALITLPILLGMALSIGYSIHFINIFKMEFRRTGKRKESAIRVVEECGWSVFFTVLTTMASLVSFAFVDMKPLAWMGKTASLVVFAVYIYVAVLVPICLSLGKDKAPDTSAPKGHTKIDLKFASWADVVFKKKILIIAATAAIFAACVPGILKITARFDLMQTTGDKMPHIKELKTLLSKKLGNLYSYSVMISYDDPDTFKDPEKMQALEELEKFLGSLRLTKVSGQKPRVNSVTDILREMFRALNEGNDEYYVVPHDEYVLAQLLELSSIEMSKDFSDFMDNEFRTAAISVDMSNFVQVDAVADIRDINQKLQELFPDAKACILGDMIEYAEMCERMVSGELKSFGFSFLIIAAMLIIAFSSIKTGLIAMIPNLAPVILIAAIMGYFKFPLDFVTVTIMPMILGIAVDDTIHLTTHLKYGLEKTGSYKTAMEDSCREIGASMFMTTFILCSIFTVYMFSPLRYLFVIGLLSVIGLAAALIADYTITPALLYLAKPFGKKKN